MRRIDMEAGTLYAITVNGMTRPGYVLHTGRPAAQMKDIKVKVAWSFPGSNEELLQETPDLASPLTKYDEKRVGTADVLCRWEIYCRNVKRERQTAIDKRNALEAAAEIEKQERINRLEAVAPLIEGYGGYCDLQDLRWLIGADRQHDSRYSAKHVLEMLEYVQHMVNHGMFDTPVSP